MAKEMKVKLPYHKFWTKSNIADGRGTHVYNTFLALCLPKEYLPESTETILQGYTDEKTGTDDGSSYGKVTLHLTPVLLQLDNTHVGAWLAVEDTPTTDGTQHHVTVKNVKFNIISSVDLSNYFDEYSSDNWHQCSDDEYAERIHALDKSVIMDLIFWVRNEGESSQYLQLVEVDNIIVDDKKYPNKVSANTFVNDVWNVSFSDYPVDDTAIGKLVRFVETDMEQYASDIIFNDTAIGETTSNTPPLRCKAQSYLGMLANAQADRSTAYVFDFTSEILIYTRGYNQEFQYVLAYLTDEHDASDELFWNSTHMYELVYDDHCVDYAEIRQHTFSNNKRYTNIAEFTFERQSLNIDEVERLNHIEFTSELKDTLTELNNMTSPLLTSQHQTPMEYYSQAHKESNVEFDEQLVNLNIATSIEEEEPTYFWVETLKNWCYYTVEEIDNACNIAMLNVWNGINGWLKLDSILERTKTTYVSPKRINELIQAYESDPTKHTAEKQKLDEIVRLMTSLLVVYPFRTETLKTIAIDRVFTPKVEPDYAGRKKHRWFNGIVRALTTIGSGIVSFWKGAFEIITSPVYIVYGDEKMFDKLVSGWKDVGKGFLDIIVGSFKVSVGMTGGVFIQELYHYLFAASPADPFSRLDHYKTLYAMCRYVELPYDTGYSSNDKTTYQTIREPKRYKLAGGIYNRTAIIPCICITSTVGTPFLVKSSSGQLLLAYDFSYSGPVGEGYASDSDFKKHPGIVESDAEFTNKLLQEQFGKGEDKTINDWLNTHGNMPDMSSLANNIIDLESKLSTNKVEQNTVVQSARGNMTVVATRSKTSSDVDTTAINTLTKW